MHTCGDISISEMLYHYHNMEINITMIDVSIILHITNILCIYVATEISHAYK